VYAGDSCTGQRPGSHLSAVRSNKRSGMLDPKILNLTAEYSNNSSSKAGDATTHLLGRN
jgi:hypothetical protein